jgi:hypothetical protein
MPITASKTANDPYGPLAWDASIVIVALEKLLQHKNIKEKEQAALKAVGKQLGLLFEASQIRLDDPSRTTGQVPVHLQHSFFTLVAIGELSSPAGEVPVLKEAEQSLDVICRHLDSGDTESLAPEMLRRAQETCLELLEHLNKQRPSTAVR